MRFLLLAMVSTMLLGCNLYFDGGGEEPPCQDDRAPVVDYPDLRRNPQTGQCEDFGWGQPPCRDGCGGCDYDQGADRAPAPSWGYCESECTGLDEATCLNTEGCRGIYSVANRYPGFFQECWQTDQGPPVEAASCEGLDAYACSTLDRCVAVHDFRCPDGEGCRIDNVEITDFLTCNYESLECYGQVCNTDVDCPDGYDKTFDECGCETGCTPSCGPDTVCPDWEPNCPEGSDPIYTECGCWTGECAANIGCSGDAECGPGMECTAPDACDCPPDAEQCPGCIATCQPVEPIECEDIDSESMCIAQLDCSPFYEGVDCTCDDLGCTCEDWAFQDCL